MRPAFVHERSVEKAYRGRQLLELLQNADDAGRSHESGSRLLIRLGLDYLVVANTGKTFSDDGIVSLVISDRSPKQLERGRYIGQKGLGFRSLLSWTDSPLVQSGEHLIAFSPEHANRIAAGIARDVERLRADMDQFAAELGCFPVPILRFPYEPPPEDSRARVAASVLEEGYDTAIVLPMPRDARREHVYADIIEQSKGLSQSTLLFSNHLREIRFEVADHHGKWMIDREIEEESEIVILSHDVNVSQWKIYRRDLSVPQHLVVDELKGRDIGLAIAVPDEIVERGSNKLCVFFPTSVTLPMAMVAHATLETDDGRKRIIEGPVSEFALRSLAEFIGEVAENEARVGDDDWRGLKLLAGSERCDPELKKLGFAEALYNAISSRRLFPAVDGSLQNSEHVWLPPDAAWRELATNDWLGDLLLAPPSPDVEFLLHETALRVMPPREQVTRLEQRVTHLAATERFFDAGTLIGSLLRARALPKDPLGALLVDGAGLRSDLVKTLLLPSEGLFTEWPSWASDVQFLHDGFADGLKSAAEKTARELGRDLTAIGYLVEEFHVGAIARRLIREAEELVTTTPQSVAQLHLDVLKSIYQLTRAETGESRIDAPFRILTDDGRVVRADQCYVGAEYPSGELLSRLYSGVPGSSFCASPSRLGLTGLPHEVENFLSRIGVGLTLRSEPINTSRSNRNSKLASFIVETLSRVDFPQELAGRVFETSDDALKNLEIEFQGGTLPERWEEVLTTGTAEAVVAYILKEALARIDSNRMSGIMLRGRRGQQYYFRDCPSVRVDDPFLYLLREVAWVPCDDGKRHQARRIALSRSTRRVLGKTFRSHSIDALSPLLSPVGGISAVHMVLRAAGALDSLDSLRGDDVYALLTELPNRDPEGVEAPSVYRTLLDAQQLDTHSTRRDEFLANGKMWGIKGPNAGYFFVRELRYAARSTIPIPVQLYTPLVDIDARRNTGDVERIFGIKELATADFRVVLNNDETQLAAWAPDAAHHLHSCIPFLYALRLSQRADDRGEERRTFFEARLIVTRRITATVEIEDRHPEQVLVDQNLKGLVVDGSVFLVSDESHFSLDPVLWRAVGDLIADLIGVPRVGSDFGSMLSCIDDRQRLRLLDHMVNGAGDSLLTKARGELAFTATEPIDWLPVKYESLEHPAHPAPLVMPSSSSISMGAGNGDPRVMSIAPPSTRAPSERELVVTGEASKDGATASFSIPEDTTLRVAERFEEIAVPPRFPLRVSHLRGSQAFGCDLISFALEAHRDAVGKTQALDTSQIVRFIEVKGRSNRTGTVELTANEQESAVRFGERYWIYRIYSDNSEADTYEIATMSNPSASPARTLHTVWAYNLGEGSGANWFRVSMGRMQPLSLSAIEENPS
jgi:hypothetical protein